MNWLRKTDKGSFEYGPIDYNIPKKTSVGSFYGAPGRGVVKKHGPIKYKLYAQRNYTQERPYNKQPLGRWSVEDGNIDWGSLDSWDNEITSSLTQWDDSVPNRDDRITDCCLAKSTGHSSINMCRGYWDWQGTGKSPCLEKMKKHCAKHANLTGDICTNFWGKNRSAEGDAAYASYCSTAAGKEDPKCACYVTSFGDGISMPEWYKSNIYCFDTKCRNSPYKTTGHSQNQHCPSVIDCTQKVIIEAAAVAVDVPITQNCSIDKDGSAPGDVNNNAGRGGGGVAGQTAAAEARARVAAAAEARARAAEARAAVSTAAAREDDDDGIMDTLNNPIDGLKLGDVDITPMMLMVLLVVIAILVALMSDDGGGGGNYGRGNYGRGRYPPRRMRY
jgi:hypothetical protein